MREILNGMLADATGQPVERIARDVDRDYIMEPDQAVALRHDRSRDLQPRPRPGQPPAPELCAPRGSPWPQGAQVPPHQGDRQPHHVRVAPVDALDEARRQALNRIGSGLVPRFARGYVRADLRLRQFGEPHLGGRPVAHHLARRSAGRRPSAPRGAGPTRPPAWRPPPRPRPAFPAASRRPPPPCRHPARSPRRPEPPPSPWPRRGAARTLPEVRGRAASRPRPVRGAPRTRCPRSPAVRGGAGKRMRARA